MTIDSLFNQLTLSVVLLLNGGMDMYILSSKQVVQEKINHIKKGFSAYVETAELANIIKKECQILQLDVYEDATELGYWFIPKKEK